jgi:hypothetical protein
LAIVTGSGCVTTLIVDDANGTESTGPASGTDTGAGVSTSAAETSTTPDATTSTPGTATSATQGDGSSDSTGPIPACPGDELDCDGVCVSVDSNGLHCGECGVQCADSEKCIGGACVCRPGLTDCGTGCVDTQSDPFHCGGCDSPCGVALCGGGDCVDSCDGIGTQCAQSCVDLETNPLHCSECGHACSTLADCFSGDCEGGGR